MAMEAVSSHYVIGRKQSAGAGVVDEWLMWRRLLNVDAFPAG